MITGQVNTNLESVIPLAVRGQSGEELALDVVIDTGYSFFLTLPVATVAALGLEQVGTGELILANGSLISAPTYLATVIWDGVARDIYVDTLETSPLIGVALMKGYELNTRFVAGETVTLTACGLS
jgi:clan AA aspartic protease